jgi:hypothetical protein
VLGCEPGLGVLVKSPREADHGVHGWAYSNRYRLRLTRVDGLREWRYNRVLYMHGNVCVPVPVGPPCTMSPRIARAISGLLAGSPALYD